MSVGFRIFFIDENERLRRISLKRFERFYLRSDKHEQFPEYAEQSVRYVLVTAQLEKRRPVAIKRIDCSVVKFNSRGQLDDREWLRGAKLAMDMVSSVERQPTAKNVIDANSRFSRRRYEHEFRWKPTEQLMRAIEEAVLRRGTIHWD